MTLCVQCVGSRPSRRRADGSVRAILPRFSGCHCRPLSVRRWREFQNCRRGVINRVRASERRVTRAGDSPRSTHLRHRGTQRWSIRIAKSIVRPLRARASLGTEHPGFALLTLGSIGSALSARLVGQHVRLFALHVGARSLARQSSRPQPSLTARGTLTELGGVQQPASRAAANSPAIALPGWWARLDACIPSAPAAASTSGLIRCDHPIAGQIACRDPIPS